MCFLSLNFQLRFATIIPSKLSELLVTVGAGGVKPIINSANYPGEIEGSAMRSDMSEIDDLLNFLRLWTCIDAYAVDIARNGRLGVFLGD